jgi:DNA-binding IclR family transcriptional regulator
MPHETYVSIKELAKRLGMDRSHARRYVLTLGSKPYKRRTPDSANQLALTVTATEAAVYLLTGLYGAG